MSVSIRSMLKKGRRRESCVARGRRGGKEVVRKWKKIDDGGFVVVGGRGSLLG